MWYTLKKHYFRLASDNFVLIAFLNFFMKYMLFFGTMFHISIFNDSSNFENILGTEILDRIIVIQRALIGRK